MFQHLLVPLDGSERAEYALPVAARVARATHRMIHLVRVISPPLDWSGGLAPATMMDGEGVEMEREEATTYLQKQRRCTMPGSFRLGKIVGIEISLHVSWFVILVLLTWSLATGWFAAGYPGWSPIVYWVTSVLASLLLFCSVLAHELAHSLVARARGLAVKNITLFIFGGVSNIEREPTRPGIEFQMALVGPLTEMLSVRWLLVSVAVPAARRLRTHCTAP